MWRKQFKEVQRIKFLFSVDLNRSPTKLIMKFIGSSTTNIKSYVQLFVLAKHYYLKYFHNFSVLRSEVCRFYLSYNNDTLIYKF